MADGKTFRPSDWMERLCSVFGNFGRDQRLHYNPSVRPKMVDGVKYLAVDTSLERQNPDAYAHVMAFLKSNGLLREERLDDQAEV